MKLFFAFLILVLPFYLWAQNPRPVSGINMLKTSRWPMLQNGKTVISVSWENPSQENAQEREWVREAIKASWEKYANIEFVGWGKSEPQSKGIRIYIDDYGWPHTAGLGTQLNGMQKGMVLTFKYLGKFKCGGFSPEDCVKFVAVHEFGHAIGLSHEQNRKDCLCQEEPQGGDGDFYVTPCDINSVMNYCNPQWSNYGKLSPLDISGIQIIYGQPGTSKSTIDIEEVKLIACSNTTIDRIKTIHRLIGASDSFVIRDLTDETDSVPQKAINRLPNLITIRFFDNKDEGKAENLKNLLAFQGYSSKHISVENMSERMSRTYPGYIEIWAKDAVMAPVVNLDEIRLVPCNSTTDQVRQIKDRINKSSQFAIKLYTQEDKVVPQKAVDRLTSAITVRYFHPNDESKANSIKKVLGSSGFDVNTILVENMLPKMDRTYPNYIEIWAK